MRASFIAEISLLSLVRRMRAGMPFIPHRPSYKHPYEQTEMSRPTGRLKNSSVRRAGEKNKVTIMEVKRDCLLLRAGKVPAAQPSITLFASPTLKNVKCDSHYQVHLRPATQVEQIIHRPP